MFGEMSERGKRYGERGRLSDSSHLSRDDCVCQIA
jgi:hypothetical protein